MYDEPNPSTVAIITWKKDTNWNCIFPVRRYNVHNIKYQSITLQKRNGFEHLLWSGGERNNPFSHLYLMSQRVSSSGNGQTCHSISPDRAQPVTIGHTSIENKMPIRCRYAYDSITYPVTYIHFFPQEIEKTFSCVKE